MFVIGIIVICVIGTLLHFVYEWSHHNKIVARKYPLIFIIYETTADVKQESRFFGAGNLNLPAPGACSPQKRGIGFQADSPQFLLKNAG